MPSFHLWTDASCSYWVSPDGITCSKHRCDSISFWSTLSTPVHSLTPKQDPSFHQTPFGSGNGSSLVILSPINQMFLLLLLFALVTLKLLRSESLVESVTSKLLSGKLLFI